MPTANISLTVTPGITFTSSTRVDATGLNQAANPLVELAPTGSLGVDFLDMPAIATAVGDASTRNYLRRANFTYEDWAAAEAMTAANTTTSATQEWWTKAVGGPITVRRAVDAPTTRSTWSAELIAGTDVTATSFYTWIPPAIGGAFRSGNLTFSVWVKNLCLSNIYVATYLEIARNTNERDTLEAAVSGTTENIPSNKWTRLSMTVNAATVDLSRGFAFGINTLSLTNPLDGIRIGQAQLEATSAPTTFARPAPLPGALAYLPSLADNERALGGQIIVQTGAGELRRFPPPPASLFNPILGWNKALGLPEWQDGKGQLLVFSYTGSDQPLVVPAGLSITAMEVHVWGAGSDGAFDRPGGVGGYSWGQCPVNPGMAFSIMVGKAGRLEDDFTGSYGFAGSGGAGGMSGLFQGSSAILSTDSARAMLVAGGGGAPAYITTPGASSVAGGNGNDPSSTGGQPYFIGAPDHTVAATVGGGGYNGGAYIGTAGRGGSGYRHVTSSGGSGSRPVFTTGDVLYTPRSTPVAPGQQLVVPGSTVPYYQDQAGASRRPGLVVVKWII